MSGRNWTRKSIEELVESYMRSHSPAVKDVFVENGVMPGQLASQKSNVAGLCFTDSDSNLPIPYNKHEYIFSADVYSRYVDVVDSRVGNVVGMKPFGRLKPIRYSYKLAIAKAMSIYGESAGSPNKIWDVNNNTLSDWATIFNSEVQSGAKMALSCGAKLLSDGGSYSPFEKLKSTNPVTWYNLFAWPYIHEHNNNLSYVKTLTYYAPVSPTRHNLRDEFNSHCTYGYFTFGGMDKMIESTNVHLNWIRQQLSNHSQMMPAGETFDTDFGFLFLQAPPECSGDRLYSWLNRILRYDLNWIEDETYWYHFGRVS